jgi:hypothetical protein
VFVRRRSNFLQLSARPSSRRAAKAIPDLQREVESTLERDGQMLGATALKPGWALGGMGEVFRAVLKVGIGTHMLIISTRS